MAVATKKTVEIEAGGRKRILAFTMAAQLNFERLNGGKISDIVGLFTALETGEIHASRVIEFFWAALTAGEPEITLSEAAQVFDELGYREAVGALAQAFSLAFGLSEAGSGNAQPPAPEVAS